MIRYKTDNNAFTGLEAAIVLIAFVVVAAVFSYVILGAGFFTTQKAQETVYKSVAQGTSNIQLVGQVYGLSTDNTNISSIQFSISIAPGSSSQDISKMNIVFSTPNATPVIYPAQAVGACTLATDTFCAQLGGTGNNVGTLSAFQQVQIAFQVTPEVPKNTIINLEIRPGVGAALSFSKTTPSEITRTNVLS
jgi:archaeal flagellin FlaB